MADSMDVTLSAEGILQLLVIQYWFIVIKVKGKTGKAANKTSCCTEDPLRQQSGCSNLWSVVQPRHPMVSALLRVSMPAWDPMQSAIIWFRHSLYGLPAAGTWLLWFKITLKSRAEAAITTAALPFRDQRIGGILETKQRGSYAAPSQSAAFWTPSGTVPGYEPFYPFIGCLIGWLPNSDPLP